MALSQKTSRMLKQLMTTLKDEIYDADSPHMQLEKEEQIRNPGHIIQRKSRSERCVDHFRFRASYTPPKSRFRVVIESESDKENDLIDEHIINEIETSEEEMNGTKVEQEESSSEQEVENTNTKKRNMNEIENSGEEMDGTEVEEEEEEEEEESLSDSDVEIAMKSTETESTASSELSTLRRFNATVPVESAGGSFFRLPLELRNEVYKELLCIPGGVEIRIFVPPDALREDIVPGNFAWFHRDPRQYGPYSLFVEILRTCSVVHAEAMIILYGHNIIRIDNASNVIPFFSSLSFLARLVVGQVEVSCLCGPEYLQGDLLERDFLSNEVSFMHKRWESSLFYLAVELKLKKMDILVWIRRDNYDVEREKIRGAIVHSYDRRYPWTAEVENLRLEGKECSNFLAVVVEVRLMVEEQDG